MNKNSYIFLAVVIAAVVGLVLFFNYPGQTVAPTPEAVLNPTLATPPSAPPPVAVTPQTKVESAVTIIYADYGFSPKTITVKKGSTVTFKNQSSAGFWPASNPHPAHSGYPTTGGCASSTFDACAPIGLGDSWKFEFDIVGSWGYHDHLNPRMSGVVIVQ